MYNKNINYYDLGCAPAAKTEDVSAGKGAPDGATFPNLDPDAMAKAIDKYIAKTNSSSKLKGLGETVVAGGKNSNINPFLIVGIAQKESGLASPSDFNVRKGNNAFGRSATSSQPNFKGSRLWYKWSSVKASVDHAASENKSASGGGDVAAYIRKQYPGEIDKGNIEAFFNKYAPAFENDTKLYTEQVGKGIDEMVKLTKDQKGASTESSDKDDQTASGSEECCAESKGGDVSVKGGNNQEKIWNFLTGEMDLTPQQAAGIMGNIQQESNFSPTALNPSSGAYGIIQWYAGRKTALENFAKKEGKKISDIAMQLKFMKVELEGSYKANVLDPIKRSKTVEQSTLIWLEKYEIPCLPGACGHEMKIRVPNANKILEKYGKGATGAGGGGNTEEGGSCKDGGGSGKASGEFKWPVPKQHAVSSCYGSKARGRLHSGLDISAPHGTNIAAADGGTVTFAGVSSGFGNTVVIKHSNGFATLYAHQKDGSIKVKKGDKVDQGQKIGQVNNTGSSQGDHLHFNIQKQTAPAYAPDGSDTEDPLKHLPKDGRSISGGDCPSK